MSHWTMYLVPGVKKEEKKNEKKKKRRENLAVY